MLGPLGYHTVGETKAHGVTDLSYQAGFGPQLSPLVPTTQAVLSSSAVLHVVAKVTEPVSENQPPGCPSHMAETRAEAADGVGCEK